MDKIEFDLDLFAEELPDQAQYFGTGLSTDLKTATAFTAASTVSGSTASSVSTLSV